MNINQRLSKLEHQTKKTSAWNGLVIKWADETLLFDGRKFKNHKALASDPEYQRQNITIELPDNGRDRAHG